MQKLISYAFFLIVIATFSACGDVVDKAKKLLNPIQQTEIISTDFTRTYEGQINNKYGITMTLTKEGDLLSGTYYYNNKGIPLKISGKIEDDGNLMIAEFNDKGSMTGFFSGQLSGPNIVGNWEKPDGSKIMPFTLTESGISEQTSGSDKVACSEQEAYDDESAQMIISKTCQYKKYKTVSMGTPDYKGRYSYEYALYEKQDNGKYLQVRNAALFNSRGKELLSLINDKIKREVDALINNPDIEDCFEGYRFKPFSFDQIGIEFGQDQISFNVTFGLIGACFALDGTQISFQLTDIEKYLNN